MFSKIHNNRFFPLLLEAERKFGVTFGSSVIIFEHLNTIASFQIFVSFGHDFLFTIIILSDMPFLQAVKRMSQFFLV